MRRSVTAARSAARTLSTTSNLGKRSSRLPEWKQSQIPKSVHRPSASRRIEPGQNRSHDADQQSKQEPNESAPAQQASQPSRVELVSSALAENESSDLVAPVHIPDDAHGVLQPDHPAMSILNHSALVIQRQIEMMNVFLGFEQANRYVIMDGRGETIGYLAEQDNGIGKAMARQLFRTHRSFTAHIFDRNQREVLRIHRPFAYINSYVRIYDPISGTEFDASSPSATSQSTALSEVDPAAPPSVSNLPLSDMRIIGETQQQWAPLRRKYNLFTYRALESAKDDPATPKLTSGDAPNTTTTSLTTTSNTSDRAIEAGMTQFSHIDSPFLSWDFSLQSESGSQLGSVNRNFAGFAREIFTDTGVYALRMDSASSDTTVDAANTTTAEEKALTLDQRAVMLAAAVSIDFDYFSRHSHGGAGIGFMPLWFPGMGGGAAEAGAGAEAGAIGGAAEEGAVGAATRGAGAVGAGEGAMAGAGTMAGYEAMQRGRDGMQGGDDASPTSAEPYGQGGMGAGQAGEGGAQGGQEGEDVWGSGDAQDPWSQGGQGEDGGGEGGGGWMDTISDFFGD